MSSNHEEAEEYGENSLAIKILKVCVDEVKTSDGEMTRWVRELASEA